MENSPIVKGAAMNNIDLNDLIWDLLSPGLIDLEAYFPELARNQSNWYIIRYISKAQYN